MENSVSSIEWKNWDAYRKAGYYNPYQEKYESIDTETEKMKLLDKDAQTAFINVLHMF